MMIQMITLPFLWEILKIGRWKKRWIFDLDIFQILFNKGLDKKTMAFPAHAF